MTLLPGVSRARRAWRSDEPFCNSTKPKCDKIHLLLIHYHNKVVASTNHFSFISARKQDFSQNHQTLKSPGGNYGSLSFKPTLAPLAFRRLKTEIKKNWLQLDLKPHSCSKLHVFGLCVVCCWWLAQVKLTRLDSYQGSLHCSI